MRPEWLTLLPVVRLPVQLVLWGLYYYQAVPRLMTFEGRNWDILTGLTAPLVYYLAFRRRKLGRVGLVVWNVAGLLLLGNIVRLGLLSVPEPSSNSLSSSAMWPEMSPANAWIPSGSEEGQRYWAALQAIRKWTKRNHLCLHEAVVEQLGATMQQQYWNDHNLFN